MNTPDFKIMTPEQFVEWQAQATPRAAGERVTEADVAHSYAEARKLAGTSPLAPGASAPQMPAARPAAEVWGKPTTFPFTCPSGATCLMRKLEVEALLTAGIIDKVSRLPGLAQELIDKSNIAPPTKPVGDGMPTMEEILMLTKMLDVIVPMAVVEPKVFAVPEDEDRQVGRIYTDSIDLGDRVAIMNRALKGLVDLDPFRAEPGEPV